MSSRKITLELFEKGEPSRIPIQVESDNKDEEYVLSDVVNLSIRIKEWRSYIMNGGPLRRFENENIKEWISRVSIEDIEWPELSTVIEDCVEQFRNFMKSKYEEKFIIIKLLGPTETCELFSINATPEEHLSRGYFTHKFEFTLLLKLKKELAYRLYDKVSNYILEIVKTLSELEQVNAIRIADDIADYRGILYPKSFIEEKYLKWHSEFTKIIKERGKYSILHCDGNIKDIIHKISEFYDGLHPLDIMVKTTIEDFHKWIIMLKELREELSKENLNTIFITGIPVELVFNDAVSTEELINEVKFLIKTHGRKYLLLSTTHRPYPGRDYNEHFPKSKIMNIKELVIKHNF